MFKISYLQVQVNVNPSSGGAMLENDAPEIRKYKKKFSGEILCAALWGVNLLIGTDNGLMLLDRSGQGKGCVMCIRQRITSLLSVYTLISRRRFDQMAVMEGQNVLVTISGRKRRIRVYYLSWLKQKILRTDGQAEKAKGWVDVGEMQGAVHFRIVRCVECVASGKTIEMLQIRTHQVPCYRVGESDRDLRLGT